jgi:uncharacterized protein YjbI with pentapeptide repeats
MVVLIKLLILFGLVSFSGDGREARYLVAKVAEGHLRAHKSCDGCWLRRSELANLDLSSASLNRAELQGTDLSSTNLAHAKLKGANLKRADLSTVVSLAGADLSGANLLEANVLDEVLYSAKLCEAILPNGTRFKCTM